MREPPAGRSVTEMDDLYSEEHGSGEPIVLVHGSWDDHTAWDAVAPLLAERFRVVAYDRRGYGRSTRSPGPHRRRGDEDDLAGLIETGVHAPAHVAGSSYGASVALALCSRRPELFRSLSIHEPPLVEAASESPALRPLLSEVDAAIRSALDQLQAGDIRGGARSFVENVALGPGAWDMLPPSVHDQLVRNAPGFLGDAEDPAWSGLDWDAAARIGVPVLVSWGSESPRWLQEVARHVAARIPAASSRELKGCGHLPHMTHAHRYAADVAEFAARASRADTLVARSAR